MIRHSIGLRVIGFFFCLHALIANAANDESLQQHKGEAYLVEYQVDQLLLAIQKRLAFMHEVAQTKWNENLPIEEKQRELQILATILEKAKTYSLDEKKTASFFKAQMEAAKEIQKKDFERWELCRLTKFAQVMSLQEERLYIDQMNEVMLNLLSRIGNKPIGNIILQKPISLRPGDLVAEYIWQIAVSPLQDSRPENVDE